jgi:hypothetical protein
MFLGYPLLPLFDRWQRMLVNVSHGTNAVLGGHELPEREPTQPGTFQQHVP